MVFNQNLSIEKNRLKEIVHEFFFNEQAGDHKRLVNIKENPGSNGTETIKEYRAVQEMEQLNNELANAKLNIAGGAILSVMTRQRVNDLDFYCENEDLREAQRVMEDYFGKPTFISHNAITYSRNGKGRRKYSVQLITRFVGPLNKIFDDFDFTITQGGYSFHDGIFSFGERFFADVGQRRLVYCGRSKYPICALYRTKKYGERGYTTPGSTLMHIAISIIRLEIKTYRDLKDQLMGIDTMYLQGLLKQYEDDGKMDMPVDYGQFINEAFSRIDGIPIESGETVGSYLKYSLPEAVKTEDMFADEELGFLEEEVK